MLNSAHGGDDWEARHGTTADEIGSLWADCGVDSECGVLRRVLMHRPGPEIEGVAAPAPMLWNALLDPARARAQHDALTATYRRFGVTVEHLDPGELAAPNIYFCRDLFVMTPVGAIVARMASAARAGEERAAAVALARLRVPILLSVHSDAIFEGADIVHLGDGVVLVASGFRTNAAGAGQVARLFGELGMEPLVVQMPFGTGHIDGGINIVDKRTAIIYPYRIPFAAYEALLRLGYTVLQVEDTREADVTMAINIVPVAPGVVVMPAGNPNTRKLLERNGVECHEVEVDELMKGGGSCHCMTGVLKRDGV